ncbi:MAG: ABC transporter substrate binding protein [Thomasclavelia sp.]|nr:ABC transporter substrate binding protein [Thomasclavelia sp.]
MKRIRCVAFFFLTLLIVLGLYRVPVEASAKKRVLAIFSYAYSYDTTDDLIHEYEEIMDSKASTEYVFMETNSYDYNEVKDSTYNQIKKSISDYGNYDSVIAFNDDALRFVEEYNNDLFKNTPILYDEVYNDELLSVASKSDNINGVFNKYPVYNTLDLIYKMYPNVQNINIIYDESSIGKEKYNFFNQAKDKYNKAGKLKELNIKYNSINTMSYSIEELKDIFNKTKDNTVYLFLNMNFDKQKNYYSIENGINFIATNTSTPVFCVDECSIGQGAIGGVVNTTSSNINSLTKMLKSVLKGTNIKEVTSIKIKPKTIFDKNVLKNNNIGENELPSNSIIINNDASFISTYGGIIIIVISVLLVGVLLSLILLLLRYKSRVIELNQALDEKDLAEKDELTGLYNAQSFYRTIEYYIKLDDNINYSVIRFDIDSFKLFNENYGINEGNVLLKSIGEMLSQIKGVTCAHLTADHFVLFFDTKLCGYKKLINDISTWLDKNYSKYGLLASFGVYQIDEPISGASICDRALMALLSVKHDATNKIGIYNDQMKEQLVYEKEMLTDIKEGLKNDEFVIYYQPQYNYQTNELCGLEALVRWNHPTKGLLLPKEFLPLMESNQLVTELDINVWENVCKQLHNWLINNEQVIPISVNISRNDFFRLDVSDTLLRLISKYDISPNYVRLEVTESSYVDDDYYLVVEIKKLKNAGFVIEMDDFGSGYSSLNTLRELPIDVLKLDMLFIKNAYNDERGLIIIKSIIDMANSLNIPVIAEGIETKEQAQKLLDIKCKYMQGFYFSKAISINEFNKLKEKAIIKPLELNV